MEVVKLDTVVSNPANELKLTGEMGDLMNSSLELVRGDPLQSLAWLEIWVRLVRDEQDLQKSQLQASWT